MAVNETIVTGRKFRKLIDEATKQWQKISFWHKASDCEFNDGKTAETKVGAIDGITDSLASTSSKIAASAKSVNTLNNNLAKVKTYVGSDGKLHFTNSAGADTVLNFSSGLKSVYGFGSFLTTTHCNFIIPSAGIKNIKVKCTTVEGQMRIVGTNSVQEDINPSDPTKVLAAFTTGDTKTVDVSKFPYWGVVGGLQGWANFEITWD